MVAILLLTAAAGMGAQATRSVWDGVYTEAQAGRGATVYVERCSACHGETLGGVEAAPALTGAPFNTTWDSVPLGDLAERIRVSMPLDAPGSLSRRQTSDVVAYLLQAGKFPAGSSELPAEAEALAQITFHSFKPTR